MTDTGYYIVAEHLFGVEADESMLALMTNYAPFKVGQSDNQDVLFYVSIVQGEPVSYVEEWRQDEEGQDTICGHTEDGNPVFEFRFGGKTAGRLVCTPGYRNGILHLSGFHSKAALDNALMILFAMASACTGTVLFHSAVVSLDGRGYMFLGKSGTGKSTHARLWLQNIPGTELMNDDNPAVRVKPDGTRLVLAVNLNSDPISRLSLRLSGDPVVEVLSADGKWRRVETSRRGEFVDVALQLGFYEAGVVRISGR